MNISDFYPYNCFLKSCYFFLDTEVKYGFLCIFFSINLIILKNPPVMQEMQVQSLSQEDPLEEGMETHSSILSRKIPWTEETEGLQSWHCNESGTTEHAHTFIEHKQQFFFP